MDRRDVLRVAGGGRGMQAAAASSGDRIRRAAAEYGLQQNYHLRRDALARISRARVGDTPVSADTFATSHADVIRLLSRNDCNVYDVEARWEAPLRADEYEAVATLIEPYVTAPPGIFSQKDMPRARRAIVDGTGLNLHIATEGWQVRRSLNLGTPEGARLSAIFYRLLAPIVPAPERPGKSWSMTR